jgi:hypothetical protein
MPFEIWDQLRIISVAFGNVATNGFTSVNGR